MIERRQFLGSVAAACAFTTYPANIFANQVPVSGTAANSLQWQSTVIETLPKNDAGKAPVVTGVSLQPVGKLLAVVGDDHNVAIYDMVSERYVYHLDRHSDWVRAAKFSSDGKMLASVGNDRKLFLWDTSNWTNPTITKRHPEAIIDVAFSSDGTRLATVGFGDKLRVYDTTNGRVVQTFKCACADNHAVAFSPSGEYLAAGGRCGTIVVWSLTQDTRVGQFKAHRQRIRSIEFTDDDQIFSCGEDQVVRLADFKKNTSIALPRHASKLYDVALLGEGLIATGGSDNKIHVWKMADKTHVGTLNGHTGTVATLDVVGTKLVSGSYDTLVRVWSMERQANNLINPRHKISNSGWNRKLK